MEVCEEPERISAFILKYPHFSPVIVARPAVSFQTELTIFDVADVTDTYTVFAPITVDQDFTHRFPLVPLTNPSPMLAVRVAVNPLLASPEYLVKLHLPRVPALAERKTC